jgi:hypothetical protein
MTEQTIKVAIIEDDPNWYPEAQQIFESLGVTVVAVATTLTEAIDSVIPSLAAQGVSYVLLDGCLSDYCSGGSDGKRLSALIKEQAPGVKTIGFSMSDQDYVDCPMGKYEFGKEALKKILFP